MLTKRVLKRVYVASVFVPALLATLSTSYASSMMADLMEDPALVGSGDFRAMFWNVYRAELYASNGEYAPDGKHALRLIYKRSLKGSAIVDKSIELMQRQGPDDELQLADWREQLGLIIPDVSENTEIVGLYDAQSGAEFYVDGQFAGQIADRAFAKYFFGIWLADSTVSPRLRSDLLGLEN